MDLGLLIPLFKHRTNMWELANRLESNDNCTGLPKGICTVVFRHNRFHHESPDMGSLTHYSKRPCCFVNAASEPRFVNPHHHICYL